MVVGRACVIYCNLAIEPIETCQVAKKIIELILFSNTGNSLNYKRNGRLLLTHISTT